jgi:hypothetical protein
VSSSKKALSVRTTDELLEDLAVLQDAGMTASDAVRFAVRRLAQAHRYVAEEEQRTGRRPAVVSIHVQRLSPSDQQV